VVHLLYGLLSVFAGHRVFRALLVITGALAGALAGWLLAGHLTHSVEATIAISAGAALVVAVAFFFLYYAAVFGLGAIAAGGLAYLVADALVADGMVVLGITCGAGVVGGLVALVLRRPVVILMTSVLGAVWASIGGLLLLTGGQHEIASKMIRAAHGQPMPPMREMLDGHQRLGLRIAFGVLLVAGVIVQTLIARKKPAGAPAPPRER
jgi:hypothetical protein